MPSIAPPKFEWHDLPCTPYNGNRVFAIYTEDTEYLQNNMVPNIGPDATPITWLQSPDYVRAVETVKIELRSWILRMHQKAGTGRLWFYSRELTEQERRTPYYVEHVRRQLFWPTVLIKQWFEAVKDESGAITTVRPHSKHRDGQTYPTTIEIRHYQADVPWKKARVTRAFPLTETVPYNLYGVEGSFPECLHPVMNYPATQGEPTREVLFGAGTTEVEVGGDFVNEHYDATPMQDWEKYPLEITKSDVLGQYDYTEVMAIPPIDDRESQT